MAIAAVAGTSTLAGTNSSSATSGAVAQNFQAFLSLLTTQLKNQNPLEPLDTNQFTQQLVQFAQVEQQMTMNTSLESLIALQQATQTAAALGFLGSTVTVDGDTARLADGKASWSYTTTKPATVTINVQNASGQVIYSENRTLNAGDHSFRWNGRDAQGKVMPAGDYKISVVAKDAAGQSVSVSTEVEGIVDGIDLTKSPAVLTINGSDYTLDKIRRVRRTGSGESPASVALQALSPKTN
jgi:flagellar basal-body rod modification protein FlgD